MTKPAAVFLLAALGLAGCRATHAELPAGGGLVSVDREPPPGATLYSPPAWKPGDRFVYVKGGISRLSFRLESTAGGIHRMVEEQGGLVMSFGEDLSAHGQEKAGDDALTVRYDPADAELSWPLWEGKQWTSSFVMRSPGREDIPLLVTYHCDATESVTVPAGTFRCLRIWRRARLAAAGTWIDRISIAWYSPDAGAFVKKLNDSILTELQELHRQ